MRYEFECELERLAAANAYFAVFLPIDVAAEIDEVSAGLRGGFGSVRVRAAIGASSWSTSIFKDNSRSSYLMLIKKTVRDAEAWGEGSSRHVTLELLDF